MVKKTKAQKCDRAPPNWSLNDPRVPAHCPPKLLGLHVVSHESDSTMDVAYNAHSTRRKNRSTTNLNHLSLAPLTSKLPLNDDDEFPDPLSAPPVGTSYLQGKSAPTTPRLLSRSAAPSRSGSRARGSSTPRAVLPKSKSATQLATSNGRHTVGTMSPGIRRRKEDTMAIRDGSDTDWLLRAGALISTETREYKGQSWLVSRESSTSLAGLRDPDEEYVDRELARAREMASMNASRRGSAAALDEDRNGSTPPQSRFGSRSQMITPLERRSLDGYFSPAGQEDYLTGPDFVNLDERLENLELEDMSLEDEAHVRRLVKRGNTGMGTWLGSVWGFQLFSVEENDNEEDSDGELSEMVPGRRLSTSSTRQLGGMTTLVDEPMPAPKADEGGWQDAAWLLSVASKVLL